MDKIIIINVVSEVENDGPKVPKQAEAKRQQVQLCYYMYSKTCLNRFLSNPTTNKFFWSGRISYIFLY